MRRPGFLEGVALALGLAVAGAVLATVLPPLLGGGTALRVLVTGLAATYGGYLLYRSPVTTGRIVVPCIWLAATLAGWALLGVVGYLLLQIVLLWLIRSLYYHGGVLAALADLGLSAFALAAAVWAFGAGSWLLTLWSFFLVQALFAWIPSRGASGADDDETHDHGFEAARELAEAALARLATSR